METALGWVLFYVVIFLIGISSGSEPTPAEDSVWLREESTLAKCATFLCIAGGAAALVFVWARELL